MQVSIADFAFEAEGAQREKGGAHDGQNQQVPPEFQERRPAEDDRSHQFDKIRRR